MALVEDQSRIYTEVKVFDHEKLKVFFRDEIVEFAEANVSVACTAFMYGLACFTGIRAHFNPEQKKLHIFRPEAHYERFRFQCKLLRYQNFLEKYPYERFLGAVCELLKVNEIQQDAYIRICNFSDENLVTPKFVGYRDSLSIFLYPIGQYVPTDGMRCRVSSWQRIADNAIPARGKINGAYINTAFAKTEALLDSYDEAIFLDSDGFVVEGSAENIFLAYGDKLVTPPRDAPILEGITRDTAMEIARKKGYEVSERKISRTELYRADEIFLTGTGAQISPVIEIDKYSVGSGEVGPIAAEIQQSYFDIVRGKNDEYADWLHTV